MFQHDFCQVDGLVIIYVVGGSLKENARSKQVLDGMNCW